MIPYFIVRGISGSGKSTLFKNIKNLQIIDADYTLLKTDPRLPIITQKNMVYKLNLADAVNCIELSQSFAWLQQWSHIDGINTTIENLSQITRVSIYPMVIWVKVPFLLSYLRHSTRKHSGRIQLSLFKYYFNVYKNFEVTQHIKAPVVEISNVVGYYAQQKLSAFLQQFNIR